MIEVELPDGTIVEFPDGTPRAVMKQALQKRFGSPQPTNELSAISQGFSPDPEEVRATMRANQIEKFGQRGAGDLFGNSFSLGLNDKVAGLAGGVEGMIQGRGFVPGYRTGQRSEEILEQRARGRTGGRGKAAEIAGTVATGVLAKAPAAGSALGRIYQTAKEAGILGTIQGAGDSEADTLAGTAGDALTGGATSAAFGGVLGAGVEAGRGLFNAGRALVRGAGSLTDDPAGRAARKVVKSLADDDVTPSLAAARMKKRGTALINTADENTLGLGRAAAAKPGEGRKILTKGLDAQQKASQGKVLAQVNQTLGGGSNVPFNRRLAGLITQRSQNGHKAYESAFKRNFGAQHAMVFDDLAKRVPGEAFKNAERIAQLDGRPFGQQLVAAIDPAGNVQFRRTPSLREWHYIQRGLRASKDAAYRAGVGEVGTAYNNLHKQVLKAMDDASPYYKAARKVYASQSDMIDALQRGREILAPSTTRNVDALIDEIAGMSRAEKQMMQIGVARQMEDMLRTTPDEAGDMVKKIFGTQAKRDAIRAAFDDDRAFRGFQARMANLAKEIKSFKYIRTGSRTTIGDAEKDAAGALAEAGSAVVDYATTGGMNSAIRGVGKMLKDIGGMDEDVAREVALILVERDPNVVLQALGPATRRVNNQAARQALLAKAAPIARALTVGGSMAGGRQAVTPY